MAEEKDPAKNLPTPPQSLPTHSNPETPEPRTYEPPDDEEDYTPVAPIKSRVPDLPAVIGFIILVVVVIWGLWHLISLTSPWLGGLFPRRTPTTPTVAATTTRPTMPTPVITQALQPATRPATPPTVRQAAPADFAVRILAVGVIDPATGQFIPRGPISPDETAAVQFDIANEGGSSTGTWYFSAELPTTPTPYQYTSPAQAPLGPGDHVVSTLRFTQVLAGGGMFSVHADPANRIRESDETNNLNEYFVPTN